MAITITKEPSSIYPAYNDCWIQFSSDLAGNDKAEVDISPDSTFPSTFLIYPDTNGVYTFNLREAIQIVLNESGFNDPNDTPPADYVEGYPYGYMKLASGETNAMTIEVFNDATSETKSDMSYEFIRGVKQIGEDIYANSAQVLNVCEGLNGTDYQLTYFEGFPFTFELQRILTTEAVSLKNLNSGDETAAAFTPASNGSVRYWVDKGNGSNWTTSGFLPLSETDNRIEVYVAVPPAAGVFKTNVRIRKVNERAGVYLKWFNADGGYSYWLFDEYRREDLRTSMLGVSANEQFLNVDEGREAPFKSIGSSATKRLRLNTRVEDWQAKQLESLYYSPSVQMYTSTTPHLSGTWVNVEVVSNLQIANKKKLNEVVVNIELPELITPKL